jgi:hypothetical protein
LFGHAKGSSFQEIAMPPRLSAADGSNAETSAYWVFPTLLLAGLVVRRVAFELLCVPLSDVRPKCVDQGMEGCALRENLDGPE